jgi:hypothetical protein
MNAPQFFRKLQEEFKRLHALGWTYKRMSEALDVSDRTLINWREELGLPRRAKGKRPRNSKK